MRFLNIMAAALLFSITASAQEASFLKWDEDEDNLLEEFEFKGEFINRYFPEWNLQKDDLAAGLNKDEFYGSTFARLDVDSSKRLEEDEWGYGYSYLYDDYIVYEDIHLYDGDGDGLLAFEEYFDTFYDSDYFYEVDVDNSGLISEHELAEYVFESWDIDESGTISRGEYKIFDSIYL